MILLVYHYRNSFGMIDKQRFSLFVFGKFGAYGVVFDKSARMRRVETFHIYIVEHKGVILFYMLVDTLFYFLFFFFGKHSDEFCVRKVSCKTYSGRNKNRITHFYLPPLLSYHGAPRLFQSLRVRSPL